MNPKEFSILFGEKALNGSYNDVAKFHWPTASTGPQWFYSRLADCDRYDRDRQYKFTNTACPRLKF